MLLDTVGHCWILFWDSSFQLPSSVNWVPAKAVTKRLAHEPAQRNITRINGNKTTPNIHKGICGLSTEQWSRLVAILLPHPAYHQSLDENLRLLRSIQEPTCFNYASRCRQNWLQWLNHQSMLIFKFKCPESPLLRNLQRVPKKKTF